MEPFRGPRLKIERAKKHINDLQARIREFENGDFYGLAIQNDPNTGNDVLCVLIAESLPDEFALIIGDALHNLKSALDCAVNDVVFNRTGKHTKYTKFPVMDTRDKLIAAVKGGTIHQASKAVGNLIMDVIEPYNGGNEAIWALHDLNILDKHMLLVPVMRVTALNGICVKYEGGQTFNFGTWVITGHRNAVSQEFPGERNVQITNHGKPTLFVVFDEGPMNGESVIEALLYLTDSVSGTIDKIETAFLAETP